MILAKAMYPHGWLTGICKSPFPLLSSRKKNRGLHSKENEKTQKKKTKLQHKVWGNQLGSGRLLSLVPS